MGSAVSLATKTVGIRWDPSQDRAPWRGRSSALGRASLTADSAARHRISRPASERVAPFTRERPWETSGGRSHAAADAHLALLGYERELKRQMNLWPISRSGSPTSHLWWGCTHSSRSACLAGPPAFWWLIIVGSGQLLVAFVFGEVAWQYPVAGGIYQWVRRLWSRRAAWLVTWVYAWAMIVTVTSVAEFSGSFASSLFGFENTARNGFFTAVGLLLLALALNFSGTRIMALIAQIGLVAELTGVVALGLFLMIFRRKNSISVLFDPMGAGGGDRPYLYAFLAASLTGLFLFYGFEACGNVAEEVSDPGRRIPHAMRLTIFVGGISAVVSFIGYLLAAPDLRAIVAGEVADPIPAILNGALGETGARLFLIVAMVSFVSCVLSLQAAASRLIYSFARDRTTPASGWLSKVSARHSVPTRALLVACVMPIALSGWVYASPGALAQITAFAVLGIYLAFQAVVFAALRMRLRGWQPAGEFTLGRAGLAVNIAALAYGVIAMILLAWPSPTATGIDRWLPLPHGNLRGLPQCLQAA